MIANVEFQENTRNAIVLINGQEVYHTIFKSNFLTSKIVVYKKTDEKLIFESYVRLIPKFKIIMADGTELPFKMTSAQALSYTCEKNGNLYEVFQHKDRKHSIFKNETMVGYFDKSDYSKFGADKYLLINDYGSDTELFLGFLFILHLIHGSDKNSFYSKDIGNIWEKRAFDTNWQPK